MVKTLAKPLSARIKQQFSRYEVTQRFLVDIGQLTHQVSSRMTIWASGYTVRNISALEEKKALSTGADFVGESFVLLVSMTTLIWEYNRSKASEKAKEDKLQARASAERQALRARLHALHVRVEALEAAFEEEHCHEEQRRSWWQLSSSSPNKPRGNRVYHAPHPSEIVPIDADDEVVNKVFEENAKEL